MVRKLMLCVSIFAIAVATPAIAGGQGEEAVPADDGADTAALERTTEDPRLYQPGQLTVATGEPVYPPWMLNDDPASGEGFENGIVYALAEEMGFDAEDVVWVRQTFDQGIAPGPKNYDFAINQYSVTEERREFVGFSNVYYQPRKAALALPDSAIADAESFADLRDADWGATIGTTDLDYLENTVGAEGVDVFDDQVGTFQALLGGQIDATVISLPTALYVTAVQVPEASIVAILPADENDLGHGLVFEKGDSLVPWVNDALEAVIADGVVDRLADEYLVGDDSIPEITE
ncbi:MAG: ABC transporter substrate-binding protein [Alkalispirochaeta sp.]